MSKKKKKSVTCGPSSSKDVPCNQNHKNLSMQEWADRLRNNPYFKEQGIQIRFVNRQK
jgi:hypothetical protein